MRWPSHWGVKSVDVTVSICLAHDDLRRRVRKWAIAMLVASVLIAPLLIYLGLELEFQSDALMIAAFVIAPLLFLGFLVLMQRFQTWKLAPSERVEPEVVTLRGIDESVLNLLGLPVRCPSCSQFVEQGPTCARCGAPLTSTNLRPSSSTAAS